MNGRYLAPLLLVATQIQAAENAEKDTTERFLIKGQIPAYQRSLSSVLPPTDLLDDTQTSIDSLATLLSGAPEVNLNGQGGLLQAINVRGFARWRIQTLVEGIPIYTERRAGTAAEFLPPSFLASAYLTPGAASTQLGSGALGGGVDLALARPDSFASLVSYASNQGYREVMAQSKQGELNPLYWQASHRGANDGKDGNGDTLFDGFEQNAFSLRKSFSDGPWKETLLLYSESNNIGKASADLPSERFTVYPSNDHLLGKVSLNWHNATFYWHHSHLDTWIDRPGRRQNFLRNDAFDLGLSFNNALDYGQWQLHWRLNADGRTGVRAEERELGADQRQVFDRINLDADQIEVAAALDGVREFDWGSLSLGGRLASIYQHDEVASESVTDTNASGFFGITRPINPHWQTSYYISSGYRVPNLTERFFNGSTPRGEVLGDPHLNTEQAINQEISVHFTDDAASGRVSVFHQRVDNYIERLRVNDELLRFRNLSRATIEGISYRWQQHFSGLGSDWHLKLGGQWLWGNDDQGLPVADIVPAQHRLSLQGQWQRSNAFVAVTHRQASRDEVSGELPTPAATTIDLGLTQALTPHWDLQLQLNNLTDKVFVTTRDDLAPLTRGRDVRLTLSYH